MRGLVSAAARLASGFGEWGAWRLEGFVDYERDGEVRGWVLDRRLPARRAMVVVRARGRIVAETLADLPRKDLSAKGIGDGRHGFRVQVPVGVSLAEARVEARLGWRRRVLPRTRGKLSTTKAPAKAAVTPAQVESPEIGELRSLTANRLEGWVLPQGPTGAAVAVDVFTGERFLGAVNADRDPPANAPELARGFQFVIPDMNLVQDGRLLRARLAGSRLDLGVHADLLAESARAAPAAERQAEASPPSAPPEVTLALWGSWSDWPPALQALSALELDWDLELLIPADAPLEVVRRAEAWSATAKRFVRIKWIDLPHSDAAVAEWRLLTQAATAPVVILCHTAVEGFSAAALTRVARIAQADGVGAVTLGIAADDDSASLAGLQAAAKPRPPLFGGARTCAAAPAAFAVFSRRTIAVEDAFGPEAEASRPDLELGLRMSQTGRQSLVLEGSLLRAPASLLALWAA